MRGGYCYLEGDDDEGVHSSSAGAGRVVNDFVDRS